MSYNIINMLHRQPFKHGDKGYVFVQSDERIHALLLNEWAFQILSLIDQYGYCEVASQFESDDPQFSNCVLYLCDQGLLEKEK